ncbi:terminase : Phage Terminase Small Subunit OS=Fusobacterium nucleatum subsp. animalis 11_3_2 GN=HMPREF0401_01601 PE=4 SV=1: Terminase_2 [Gemmata massiliana]|uniref:Uncharacterized protein n=1 Tax=Gemmata massiliana TaxID=1210884 RepID=A0A6P2D1C7_9BACT|nr:terminase small subunit [Gemmata massiliana]VTR95138.1 terminase : Phage Terminase Small Subunit OS=Fusobacterium nucleatum subsp. animalis 11_3_2 GN=HMPREF0401_01601 PE=4 SV=1: Terminase_2 [Gemmata massiliana]
MARKKLVPDPPPLPVKPGHEPLDPDEDMFVTEYLKHFNQGRAYRTVHPHVSRASADVLGHRLLKKVKIRAEIAAVLRERRRRAEVTFRKVLRAAAEFTLADVGDCVGPDGQPLPVQEIPPETRTAITRFRTRERTVTVGVGKQRRVTSDRVFEIQLANKIQALGFLFRHLGMDTSIPPLEVLFQTLPRAVAEELRAAMAQGTFRPSEDPVPIQQL